jgi:hypothetical protein
MGEIKNSCNILAVKPEWGIILEWILGKWNRAGCIWIRIWTSGTLVNTVINFRVP